MLDADAARVLDLLGPAPRSVLDAPCGDGRIALRLAAAGHDVVGVDIMPGEVALARRAAAAAGLPARFTRRSATCARCPRWSRSTRS